MGKFGLLFVIFLIVIGACEKPGGADPQQHDNLDRICLLGQWKMQRKIIDGTADGGVECCDYMEFKKEGQPNDFIGKLKVYGVDYEKTCVFELNERLNMIQFEFENQIKTCAFQISGDWITITYSENGQSIAEVWRKED